MTIQSSEAGPPSGDPYVLVDNAPPVQEHGIRKATTIDRGNTRPYWILWAHGFFTVKCVFPGRQGLQCNEAFYTLKEAQDHILEHLRNAKYVCAW